MIISYSSLLLVDKIIAYRPMEETCSSGAVVLHVESIVPSGLREKFTNGCVYVRTCKTPHSTFVVLQWNERRVRRFALDVRSTVVHDVRSTVFCRGLRENEVNE